MARRKSPKKSKRSGKKRSGGGFSLGKIDAKPLITVFICVALLAGAGYGIWHFFMNSSFFRIKEISVTDDRGYTFEEGESEIRRLYMGANIFGADLKRISALIRNNFPQVQRVETRRQLPDKLEVDIISRTPVAVIDTAGGIVIDKEGVVLAVGTNEKDLIRVRGISFFLNMPSRGESIDNPNLQSALLLIQGMRKKMRNQLEDIEYVNISDRNNIIIGVRGTRVKIGTGDFSGKIDTLREMLNDPNIDMNDIQYIDLRFDDPVISVK